MPVCNITKVVRQRTYTHLGNLSTFDLLCTSYLCRNCAIFDEKYKYVLIFRFIPRYLPQLLCLSYYRTLTFLTVFLQMSTGTEGSLWCSDLGFKIKRSPILCHPGLDGLLEEYWAVNIGIITLTLHSSKETCTSAMIVITIYYNL